MTWIARALIGPSLWAIAFAVVYGLHGYGCARGWPLHRLGPISLHHGVLWAGYAVALALSAAALVFVPRGKGRERQIIQAGGWIGFGATLFTLFPVTLLTSCF